MVDKKQDNDAIKADTKICMDIVNTLDKKHVDWYSITDSLLNILNEGKSLSEHQYAIISTLGIAQLGVQLSDTNTKLDKIERLLKVRTSKSSR